MSITHTRYLTCTNQISPGKISAPTETDTDLDYTGQMHLTKEPVRSTGHPSTGSFCPEHSYITPYNEVTGPRLLHATETLVQAIEQQQSIEEVEQAHPQPPVAIVPFQRIVKRRERKEPVQKRERAEKRKRERAENMETDFEVENYPVHQVTNALVPIPTQSRQIIATSERFYARQYAPKKVDVVVESMLPRFTMPPKTIQPETLLLQAREKERIKRAEINTPRVNVAEMKEQHLDNERLSARASRAANRLNRQAASISSANSRGQQFAHRVRTSRHPTPLGHMESAESSSSTHESEVYQSKLSTSEDGLRSESIDTILQPRPAFSEDYLEPYKSTYFFPQLDDYGPPQPVVYWHMENQMHPSVPNRATPKVGSVTGLVDLLPKTETTKPTVSSNFEGLDPELAELLKPMTDDEDDTQDVVDSDEESGDDRAQEPCIVKFPLDAPIRQVKEYSELKQALKEGLAQRNQVYERLENGVEVMKRGLKQQELFEKREKWGERSHPTRPTGTKSRATAVVENTDFLDWLRAKAGEE